MRRLYFGSLLAALGVAAACSSFDGAPEAVTPSDDGGPMGPDGGATDGATTVDGDSTEPAATHATPMWLRGYGSSLDDNVGGIAISSGSMFVSAKFGGQTKVGGDDAGMGGIQAHAGAAVVRASAMTGDFAGALFNFSGGDDTSFIAGPLVATSSFVYASASNKPSGSNYDTLLRRLATTDLVASVTPYTNVESDGEQIVAAAAPDGVTGGFFALQTSGRTSIFTAGTPNPVQTVHPQEQPGVVGFGDQVTPYFELATDTSAKVRGTAIDASGRVVLAGWYTGQLQNGPDGGLGPPAATDDDAYVVRTPRDGSTITDRVFFGGGGQQRITSLAIDKSDRYVAGTYVGSIASGNSTLGPLNGTRGFAAKVDDANVVRWLVDLGVVGGDFYVGIAVDETRVIVTGSFAGMTTMGGDTLVAQGGTDIFVASLSRKTGQFRTADRFGGAGVESASTITTDGQGRFFIGGTFDTSTSLDGQPVIPAVGGKDIFALGVFY